MALLESLPDKRGHYNMDVIKVDFLEELDDKDITSSIASAIEDQVRTKPERQSTIKRVVVTLLAGID